MKRSLRVTFSACVFLVSIIAGWTARAAEPTTADCLDASEKSLALRNQHKLREARDQLLICSAGSCPADIRDECIRRVDGINAAMPTLVFEAKDAAGNDLVAVKVTMDGQPVADRLDGVALSIDPGEHAFTFAMEGQPPVVKKLVLREGEKHRQERIAFGVPVAPTPAAAPIPVSAPIVAPELQAAPPPSETLPRGFGTQRILALVSAGVGVVGLGFGIGYGLAAMSKHDEAKKACPGLCTDQHGVDLWNQASSAGNVSTVGFIVGAAGIVGGAVLWFTARPAASETGQGAATQVGFGLGSVQCKGVW